MITTITRQRSCAIAGTMFMPSDCETVFCAPTAGRPPLADRYLKLLSVKPVENNLYIETAYKEICSAPRKITYYDKHGNVTESTTTGPAHEDDIHTAIVEYGPGLGVGGKPIYTETYHVRFLNTGWHFVTIENDRKGGILTDGNTHLFWKTGEDGICTIYDAPWNGNTVAVFFDSPCNRTRATEALTAHIGKDPKSALAALRQTRMMYKEISDEIPDDMEGLT